MAANRDPRFGAEISLLEFERQVLAEVGAALDAAAASASATTSAEHVAESEKLAENVAEVLEDRRIETRALTNATESGVSEAIVGRSFVGIGEDGVGLTHFLEFFFRIRIVGITVRMVLERELAICALQFHFSHSAAHTQHFVVVAFCVRRQRNLSSMNRMRANRSRIAGNSSPAIFRDSSRPSPSRDARGGL